MAYKCSRGVKVKSPSLKGTVQSAKKKPTTSPAAKSKAMIKKSKKRFTPKAIKTSSTDSSKQCCKKGDLYASVDNIDYQRMKRRMTPENNGISHIEHQSVNSSPVNVCPLGNNEVQTQSSYNLRKSTTPVVYRHSRNYFKKQKLSNPEQNNKKNSIFTAKKRSKSDGKKKSQDKGRCQGSSLPYETPAKAVRSKTRVLINNKEKDTKPAKISSRKDQESLAVGVPFKKSMITKDYKQAKGVICNKELRVNLTKLSSKMYGELKESTPKATHNELKECRNGFKRKRPNSNMSVEPTIDCLTTFFASKEKVVRRRRRNSNNTSSGFSTPDLSQLPIDELSIFTATSKEHVTKNPTRCQSAPAAMKGKKNSLSCLKEMKMSLPAKGTLKHKRMILDLLRQNNEGYEDDIFANQNIPNNFIFPVGDDESDSTTASVATPKFGCILTPAFKKTPRFKDCISPTELLLARKNAEEYLYRRTKNRRTHSVEKDVSGEDSNLQTEVPEKKQLQFEDALDQLAVIDKNMQANINDESDEDDYFSDISE